MAVKRIEIDFGKIGKPLRLRVRQWVRQQGITPPCLLVGRGVAIPEETLNDWESWGYNLMSAVPAPDHPFLFAKQDLETGEISFPFRKDIGKGKRRQDLEPVYLFVEGFAFIHEIEAPFRPLVVSGEVPAPEDYGCQEIHLPALLEMEAV